MTIYSNHKSHLKPGNIICYINNFSHDHSSCVTLGIWEYIQDVRDAVHDLEKRLQRTKDNVEEIHSIMKNWIHPIFERKDGKKDTLLNLEDKQECLEKIYGQIRTSGAKIHYLLKVSGGEIKKKIKS